MQAKMALTGLQFFKVSKVRQIFTARTTYEISRNLAPTDKSAYGLSNITLMDLLAAFTAYSTQDNATRV